MNYKFLFITAICSAIALCGENIQSLAAERMVSENTGTEMASESMGSDCFSKLEPELKKLKEKSKNNTQVGNKNKLKIQRVELFYYRNSDNIINILNKLPFADPGCASDLPINNLKPGVGVGQGGGNIIFLVGTTDYIKSAQRFITAIDLPLPGIKLQLWGIQVSSNDPKRLAKSMTKVRQEIDLTQQLVRETFQLLKSKSVEIILETEQFPLSPELSDLLDTIGYSHIKDSSHEPSILDVGILGNFVDKPREFYLEIYKSLSKLETDKRYKYYFASIRKTGRQPFERFFRSRGFIPNPICNNIQSNKDNSEISTSCGWIERNKGDVKRIAVKRQKEILEFAFQYADFSINPNDSDFEALQQTADSLNTSLQNFSDSLQKDIEDFFTQPTLNKIQELVRKEKKVTFAQVGRTTISTLSGVKTVINSASTSVFKVAKSRNAEQLLSQASTLQNSINDLLPASSSPAEVASSGVPITKLLGLAIALAEQQIEPVEAKTGTKLTITPGILRNSNSAELNIDLKVTDPTFKGTGDNGTNEPKISRVGTQIVQTSVYTQALDFFDLSTFANQATLDGGRFRIPIIGQVWHAIFGGIPVLGNLFSFPRGNQNVSHESLLLTNSFITPTPLGISQVFPLKNKQNYDRNFADPSALSDQSNNRLKEFDCTNIPFNSKTIPNFCKTQSQLNDYLGILKDSIKRDPTSDQQI